MSAMKATDAEILDAIERHWQLYQTSPTIRQLAAAVGLNSPHSTLKRLDRLVREGRLVRRTSSPRKVIYRVPS